MLPRTFAVLAGLAATLAASAHASSPAPKTAQATPLSVTLSCYSDTATCHAYASGGSGEGYSFEWEMVSEQYDMDGYSWGDMQCYGYIGWRTVYVTVSDSNNAYTGDAVNAYCQP